MALCALLDERGFQPFLERQTALMFFMYAKQEINKHRTDTMEINLGENLRQFERAANLHTQ